MRYQRGEDSEKAFIGAMLVADGITSNREIARFCEGLGKALSKKKRGR
jgi:hypothetical protein